MEVLETLPLRHPIPILLVTHELEEVIRLAPEMIWLEEGRVRAAGPTHELLARTEFVRWRGDDAGVAAPGRVVRHDQDDLTILQGPWGEMAVPGRLGQPGRTVRLRILARDVSLALAREVGSTLVNQFALEVRAVEELAPGEALVRLASSPASDELLARVTRRSAERLQLAPGRQVWARVKSVAVVGAP
jgi:molybdate transport system ATP-binding protein